MTGEEIKGMTVTGRFFKRISKPQSDRSAQLVRAKNVAELPISISNKKEKGKPLYVMVVGYSLPEED